MTRPPTHELISALKLAREEIKTKRSCYICLALVCLSVDGRITDETRRYLCGWIEKQLYPQGALCSWQDRNGIYHDENQRCADRIAWIDWMISEIERDGK